MRLSPRRASEIAIAGILRGPALPGKVPGREFWEFPMARSKLDPLDVVERTKIVSGHSRDPLTGELVGVVQVECFYRVDPETGYAFVMPTSFARWLSGELAKACDAAEGTIKRKVSGN
jgi:hypothetical protein